MLKEAGPGDIIDFYGPCDHAPLGIDEVQSQKLKPPASSNARMNAGDKSRRNLFPFDGVVRSRQWLDHEAWWRGGIAFGSRPGAPGHASRSACVVVTSWSPLV